jgi:hypothetical protein
MVTAFNNLEARLRDLQGRLIHSRLLGDNLTDDPKYGKGRQ